MAKLKPNEKRVQLSFQRPDDLALYERLVKMAYDRRYELDTFILLSLQEAFCEDNTDEEIQRAIQAAVSSRRAETDRPPGQLRRTTNASSDQPPTPASSEG